MEYASVASHFDDPCPQSFKRVTAEYECSTTAQRDASWFDDVDANAPEPNAAAPNAFSLVSTLSTLTACGFAYEVDFVLLQCHPGSQIHSIAFAKYGNFDEQCSAQMRHNSPKSFPQAERVRR